MVQDPGGHLAELLNARWKPRAYLLDAGGKVAYVQPDRTLDPLVIQEVRRRISTGR